MRSVRKTGYDERRCAFILGKSLRMIERMMEEPDSQPYKEERERKDRDHPRSCMIPSPLFFFKYFFVYSGYEVRFRDRELSEIQLLLCCSDKEQTQWADEAHMFSFFCYCHKCRFALIHFL